MGSRPYRGCLAQISKKCLLASMVAHGAAIGINGRWRLLGAFIAVVGASALGVIVTLLHGVCRLMRINTWHVEIEIKVPITTEDSPLPTYSARLMSSASHKRMNQSMRARRRGGARRYGGHRNCMTVTFGPPSLHDCGFACVLRAAGRKIAHVSIRHFRREVASKVYVAHIENTIVHNMSVRDMVQETGHSLNAYVAALRWNLWPSSWELCLVADVLGIDIGISVGGSMILHGETKQVVRLAHPPLHTACHVETDQIHGEVMPCKRRHAEFVVKLTDMAQCRPYYGVYLDTASGSNCGRSERRGARVGHAYTTVLHDVMDARVRGDEHISMFVIKVDQLWSRTQLVAYVAKILGKQSLQISLTDLQVALALP